MYSECSFINTAAFKRDIPLVLGHSTHRNIAVVSGCGVGSRARLKLTLCRYVSESSGMS